MNSGLANQSRARNDGTGYTSAIAHSAAAGSGIRRNCPRRGRAAPAPCRAAAPTAVRRRAAAAPRRSSLASASSTSKSMSTPNVFFSHCSMRPSSSSWVGGAAADKQEVIGQERLLAFLLLGVADDVVEDAGVVVDVAEVDVVGRVPSGTSATGAGYFIHCRMMKPPSATSPLDGGERGLQLAVLDRAR